MKRSIYGWDYPPSAEHDPRAPWNQEEAPPDCCSDCEHLRYDSDGDYAWCVEGEFEIEGSLNDISPGCPLDRRDSIEEYEDHLADMADRKRKGEL